MSDQQGTVDRLRFNQTIQLSICEPYFPYIQKKHTQPIALAISITNHSLHSLYRIKQDEDEEFNFIRFINRCLDFVVINEECDRLEERFRVAVGKHMNRWKTIRYKGQKARESYLSSATRIHVSREELVSVSDLQSEVIDLKIDNIHLEARASYFYKHFLKCTCESSSLRNTSSKYDEVKDRQQIRKKDDICCKVKKALHFGESFGIKFTNIDCRSDAGKEFSLDLSGSQKPKSASYNSLPGSEKQKVANLVYILDKGGVSNETYGKLSKNTELPIQRFLNECRQTLDAPYTRIPGGVMVQSLEEETANIVKLASQRKEYDASSGEPLSIKFGGDGTKVSRIATFISFTLSSVTASTSQSSSNQRIVAILKSNETYENLKSNLEDNLFKEINDLFKMKEIEVDGTNVPVTFYMGSDMKMISSLLGIKGAIAKQSCPWCLISKEERYKIPPSIYHYHFHQNRKMEDMLNLKSKRLKDGMKGEPLVHIDTNNVVPDILHMMMRITDILERNLIDEFYDLDSEAKKNKLVTNNVTKLTSVISSCGVSFQIWKSSESRSGRDYQTTSLTGSQKLKVLTQLPQKLTGMLHKETEPQVLKLWNLFAEIYFDITVNEGGAITGMDIFTKAKKWFALFLGLGAKRKGYAMKNITPYMHVLIAHIPFFMDHTIGVKYFCGQGLEKLMDDVKHVFRTKTSKFDPVKETFIVRKRVEQLHESCAGGTKRKYEKRNTEFWENEKQEIAKKRKRLIEEEQNACVLNEL